MTGKENGERILIVDDIAENLRLLGTILKTKNYQINAVRSGLQALEMIERVPPDLILLDIKMPEMDGFETCAKLKESELARDIPVIFLTAQADPEDIVHGLELGAVDYVSKPFNSAVLLARVRTHLSMRRMSKELKNLSEVDSLTGLANRRKLDHFLELEWRRCLRQKESLALLLLDIDYFKSYNDTYGHQMGDDVLRQVAEVLQSFARRPGDLAARYGGEEFLLIHAGMDEKGAHEIAQSVLTQIEALNITHESSESGPVVTASLGMIALIPDKSKKPEDMLKEADKRLYEAKNAGRNQAR